MTYVPAARIKVVKPFVHRGETVPAGYYLSPTHIAQIKRLPALLDNGTLLAAPDPHKRKAQLPGTSVLAYLTPKVVAALIAETLTASFTATPTGLSVAFDGSASSGTRTRTDWIWDFGDGTTVTEQDANVTHVYAEAGTYTVKLRVVDTYDCISVPDVDTVTVSA